MKRKIIQEEIYCKYFEYQYNVRFKDIPKDVQENDIIIIQHEEAHYSNNESNDAYTLLAIYREREENDEEYNKRITKKKTHDEYVKQKRYENYLILKEEFEPKQ